MRLVDVPVGVRDGVHFHPGPGFRLRVPGRAVRVRQPAVRDSFE